MQPSVPEEGRQVCGVERLWRGAPAHWREIKPCLEALDGQRTHALPAMVVLFAEQPKKYLRASKWANHFTAPGLRGRFEVVCGLAELCALIPTMAARCAGSAAAAPGALSHAAGRQPPFLPVPAPRGPTAIPLPPHFQSTPRHVLLSDSPHRAVSLKLEMIPVAVRAPAVAAVPECAGQQGVLGGAGWSGGARCATALSELEVDPPLVSLLSDVFLSHGLAEVLDMLTSAPHCEKSIAF